MKWAWRTKAEAAEGRFDGGGGKSDVVKEGRGSERGETEARREAVEEKRDGGKKNQTDVTKGDRGEGETKPRRIK